MTASAGLSAALRIGGTPVHSTAEAFTNTDGGFFLVFQVSNTAHRILWPPSGLTVKVNTIAVDPSLYTVDPLFGVVSFTNPLAGGDVVTADMYYVPTYAIANGKAATVKMSAAMLDATTWDSAGWKDHIAGIMDATVTLNQLVATSDQFNGTTSIDTLFAGKALIVIEVQLTTQSPVIVFRMYCLISEAETKAALAALIEGDATFVSANPLIAGASVGLKVFGFGAP